MILADGISFDGVVQIVFGAVITSLIGAVAGLISKILDQGTKITLLEARTTSAEKEVEAAEKDRGVIRAEIKTLRDWAEVQDGRVGTQLEQKIVTVQQQMITRASVKEIIDEALDKRDVVAEKRRVEWDARFFERIQVSVHKEMNDQLPKLFLELKRDLKNTTGYQQRGGGRDDPPSGQHRKP